MTEILKTEKPSGMKQVEADPAVSANQILETADLEKIQIAEAIAEARTDREVPPVHTEQLLTSSDKGTAEESNEGNAVEVQVSEVFNIFYLCTCIWIC